VILLELAPVKTQYWPFQARPVVNDVAVVITFVEAVQVIESALLNILVEPEPTPTATQ
jgi:hypothetical protein